MSKKYNHTITNTDVRNFIRDERVRIAKSQNSVSSKELLYILATRKYWVLHNNTLIKITNRVPEAVKVYNTLELEKGD